MALRTWTRETAMAAVQNAGHKINTTKHHITPSRLVGNHCWGAVEYLTKQHGFTFDWQQYRKLSRGLLAAPSLD